MNLPLISIITNFYNTEKYLKECIDSAIDQTYGNWELILVDDGSTDGSTLIAKKYAEKYSNKIFYYEHEDHKNKGTSASRNLGIKNSSGRVITFLDADDVYLSNRLEEQVKIMKKYNEADVIIGATKYWFSWENAEAKDQVQTLEISSGIYKPPQLLQLMLTDKIAVPCMGSIMVKKEIINSGCWMEDDFKGMYDDQVFYSKLMLSARIFVDNNYYDLYRQHKDSCYSRARLSNSVLSSEYKFLIWLQDYIANNYKSYHKLRNTLNSRLWLLKYPKAYNLYRRLNKIKRKIRIA